MTRTDLKQEISKFLKDEGYKLNEFDQAVITAKDGNSVNLNVTILTFLDEHNIKDLKQQ